MDLAKYGMELANAAKEAGDWVDRNPDIVRNERESLLKDLRKAARKLRTCAKSAARRTSVGVFGASQAGKSYLISALASNENNKLMALFDKDQYDFITEINPKNDSESTGLVTRFTMERPKNPDKDFPVRTRLLTETDLVKILANTWYEDMKHTEEASIDLARELEALRASAGPEGSGIDLDSLEALQEYLQNHFRQYAQIPTLDKEFWPQALDLGQRLDLEGRVRLYSLLWDKNEKFTNLLRRLLKSLEKIDFSDELHCGIDSLIPRDNSIINVSTLMRMDDDSDVVAVRTPAGKSATLPRGVVTALIAELIVVMNDVPKGGGDYFQETDLLDFPGYRSRKKDDAAELDKDPGKLFEYFLRGKVSYLFQRYCDEMELNNMLLCVGPSNQEVQDLPGVIKSWIATTHGADPAERAKRRTSLFFILTKVDMDFNKDAGSDKNYDVRWDNRIRASMLNFFGTTGWTTEWTPGSPFNNLFLLRNPVYEWDAVLDYEKKEIGKDSAGKPLYRLTELGVMPKSVEFVENMHQGFLASKLAGEHFKDLERSWNALMTLNDGGIGYIRESLGPVCDPSLKIEQLGGAIEEVRNGVAERLKKFYKSDDREELRKQKEELSRVVTTPLNSLRKVDRLGALLESFVVSDSEVYEMHRQAERRYRERLEEKAKEIAMEEVSQENDDLFDDEEEPTTAAQARQVAPEDDEAAFFASFIEEKWVEKLHGVAEDPNIKAFFHTSPTILNNLAGEMATAVARYGLKEQLASDFRRVAAYANTSRERISRQQSIIAARRLNTFLDWLGWNPAREPDKPRITSDFKGKEKEVFPREAVIEDIPDLPAQAVNFSRAWLLDWLRAVTDMMRLNVDFDGKTTINVAENNALGAILKTLKKDAAAEA